MSRQERDSLGNIQVPDDALWGAQTQRAIRNFRISGPLPNAFIRAVALIKEAAARTNGELGLLPAEQADAIAAAAARIAAGEHADQFPVDVYQTGSGTSTNMNVNEVIAFLCAEAGVNVHPNDHVNLGQSSNDTIPSAIHVSAVIAADEALLPGLRQLRESIRARADELRDVVKTGRTHLMDAMPVTFDQVLLGWDAQLELVEEQIRHALAGLLRLPQGGTAVGTGINCHRDFPALFCRRLSERTGQRFEPMASFFAGQGAIDRPLAYSASLRAFAIAMTKIANDLRWMNSGPQQGLAEISLPALQPGSSIMPGKVNPVACESALMVCVQVQGLDHAVGLAAQSGNFELNVMLPLVANDLLTMTELLSNASRLLADSAIAGFTVNRDRLDAGLGRNPILVTALNPVIGYARAAEIAKQAYASGRPVIDVAEEMTELSRAELERILDPLKLARGD